MSIQPTALITGANKGIGLSIAKGLGRLGYEVWIGSRDADRGRLAVEELEAVGIDARVLMLDVSDLSSVKAAAAFLQRQIGALDVLVNNAGIVLGPSTLPSEQPMDELKAVYEVNVFGAIRVTQSFLRLLKAAPNARIVMMSSGLGSLGLVTNPESIYSTANLLAYNSSKTALNAVAVAFAKEFKPFGIKVNAVEPGSVATDLNGNNGALTPDEGAISAIMLATIGPDGPTGQFFGVDGPRPW
jgi:NAD(P)-dependent dehydrogenase (short-subunit alcohol dehydrogenase family)